MKEKEIDEGLGGNIKETKTRVYEIKSIQYFEQISDQYAEDSYGGRPDAQQWFQCCNMSTSCRALGLRYNSN
jgi:hypothetical protein